MGELAKAFKAKADECDELKARLSKLTADYAAMGARLIEIQNKAEEVAKNVKRTRKKN